MSVTLSLARASAFGFPRLQQTVELAVEKGRDAIKQPTQDSTRHGELERELTNPDY